MPTRSPERFAEETDVALQETVRRAVPADDAADHLASLISAFDARRRSRETLALEESARAFEGR